MCSCNFLLALHLLAVSVCVKAGTVSTYNGVLDGKVVTTLGGRAVNAFLGVPYAKPPVGKLRFKEPQPANKWEGIQTAHDFGPQCIQYMLHDRLSQPIYGEEDCLYLNIYSPIVSNISKLDVIVFIHGGGFVFGTGNVYAPDYLLDEHDVILVTINYRLGPFGFLTTEDGVIPGNNGMKDQVLALKWIQDNIEQFGGNKNKVTIAGLSAGGASVHLHYLSPISRDLFHQGISLSGSAFCPWVLTENSRSKAKILADSIGCPSEDSVLLLDCLQKKDVTTILSQVKLLFWAWDFNPFTALGPVIEEKGSNAFLNKHPYKLITEGNFKDAPWLTSITTEEGLFPAASFLLNNKLMQQLNDNWADIAPHLLDYNYTLPQKLQNEVSTKIRKFYLGDKTITKDKRKELTQMLSDRLFVADIERNARLQASFTKSPVYFYNFAYRGKYSLSHMLCKCTENLGVSHADDLMYVFPHEWAPLSTKEDLEMMRTMVRMWISFAHTGIPTVNPEILWTPVSPNVSEDGSLSYLTISSGKSFKLSSSTDLANRKFWDALPFKELWNLEDTPKRQVDEL